MPITIFDAKGIPATRRERIEAAVAAAGRHLSRRFEAWIVAERCPPGYAVRMTGAQGFDRVAQFSGSETEAEITERVRVTLED